MSDHERTGARDLTYSGWHRTAIIRQYGLSSYEAWVLGLIDIDNCEYCRHCNEPLALIETQVSTGPPKPAPVTARLAQLACICAYSVSITKEAGTITLFKVRQIEPPARDVTLMLPGVYAYWLYAMRENHDCPKRNL